MRIIPVIDLKNGVAVHAKQGNREQYAPLVSNICQTAEPFAVIGAYIQLFEFDTVYIADLDALTHQGHQAPLLTKILRQFPTVNFWIDAGFPLPDHHLADFANYLPVYGSESFTDESIHELSVFNKKFILSLDYSQAGQMGAKSLFCKSGYWPENIIIMSLPHVGNNLGPDTEKLSHYRGHYPGYNFIAAGGVRNMEDLHALKNIGVNHCLIASALHNGNITPEKARSFRQKNTPAERGIFS